MDCFPNPDECPKNIFNTWIPFAAELWDSREECDQAAIDAFKNHVLILCNHQEDIANKVVMPWIAHMIQFPEHTYFVINFISCQGGGKGTLIEIITKVIGQAKFLETPKPPVDVFGNHNAQMATKFFVALDEVKKNEMIEVQGRFKGLVTEGTLNINPKGKDQCAIKSYHRLMTTSNNDDSMPTEHGDRRNVIIKCSDEKCADIEYFKTMRKYINDERSMWSIYDYLKKNRRRPLNF